MTKRILDDKTRRELIGFLPFSSESTMNFTPSRFNDVKLAADFRPVFQIRSFTKSEKAQFDLNQSGYTKDNTKEQTEAIWKENEKLIRACIMGWSNFIDIGKQEEIAYVADPKGGCDEALFSRIPDWIVIEMMHFIHKLSSISAPEKLSLK